MFSKPLTSIVASAAILMTASFTTQAQIEDRPYWVTSYNNMVRALQYHQVRSRGLVDLEDIGNSNQGRDIWLVKVGDPQNRPVMIVSQQHGNEVINTEASLQLIQWLYRSPEAAQIRDELYVLIVPRVNPDGTALYQRYNYDPAAPDRDTDLGFYTGGSGQGRGWDINRYHDIEWTESLLYQNFPNGYPTNPVPEAVAVGNAVKAYDPYWIVDFHGQFQYRTAEGEDITSSILWPTNAAVEQEPLELSQQLAVVTKDHLDQFFYSTLTRYPGGDYPGIARNAYGLYGIGSVLVELKGGSGVVEQPGMLITHALEIMKIMLLRTADGSLENVDPGRVEEIPTDEDNRFPYFTEEGEEAHEH